MSVEFESPYYRPCDDPECPVAYAYRSPYPDRSHWHFVGSPDHPAESPARGP